MLGIEHMAFECANVADFACNNAWLIMLTRTCCTFYINDSDVKYPPNCIVLYKPGQNINLSACGEAILLDYICFTTDEAYFASTTQHQCWTSGEHL